MIDPNKYEHNIWKLYPQYKLIFKDIYESDDSEEKLDSSSILWGIILLEHPDSDFQFYSYEDRKIAISKAIPKINWDQELIDLVLQTFFDSEARSLALWNRKIEERDSYMLSEPYTRESAEDLDKLMKNTKTIKDGYKKAKEEYEESKRSSSSQVKGGAEESLLEKLSQ
jgi:hypothetical protein